MSVLQTVLDAISVPAPRERDGIQYRHDGAFRGPMEIDDGGLGAESTVPVYLSPKSLTFAGVTTASAVIAGFLHNVTKTPVLELAAYTGGIMGVLLVALGFASQTRPKLTLQFVLETLIVGVINVALLIITIYGAISVAQAPTS